MKIKEYLAIEDKFIADKNYQRPAGVWSKEDMQYLIDTIINDDPMPLFVINKIDDKHYIVDGQQRLYCINKFLHDGFKLSKKIFNNELANKSFSELDDKYKNKIYGYDLKMWYIENCDDEHVRAIFSKLQRGKNLLLGEKINAKPGEIVLTIRKLAKEHIFKDNYDVKNDRFQHFEIITRLLIISKNGLKSLGVSDVNKFLEDNKNLDINDPDVKNVKSILKYIHNCFGKNTFIEDGAMFTTIYSFVNQISKEYVLKNQNERIRKFLVNFYDNLNISEFRHSNSNYGDYYDHKTRFSEKDNRLRLKILIEEFKKSKYCTKLMDVDRQITTSEKKEVFAKYKHKCSRCGTEYDNYKKVEYHHIIRHIDGGETEIKNILPLCNKCHKEVHKLDNVSLKDNYDFYENDSFNSYDELY